MTGMPKARNMNNTKIVNAKQTNVLYFKRTQRRNSSDKCCHI